MGREDQRSHNDRNGSYTFVRRGALEQFFGEVLARAFVLTNLPGCSFEMNRWGKGSAQRQRQQRKMHFGAPSRPWAEFWRSYGACARAR